MSLERSVIWRRLDVPGMDACQFRSEAGGWTINGTAIFIANDAVASLIYSVACAADWSTRTASVSGWIGGRNLSISLERTAAAGWRLDGAPLRGVENAALDIDFGFTPATNTNAVRRLDLEQGEEAEITALWLDTSDWMLKPLQQVYRRKSETVLGYASPRHDYRADLTVDPFGVVEDYPGLWAAVKIEARN